MTEMEVGLNPVGMTVVFKTHFTEGGRKRWHKRGDAPPSPPPPQVFRTPRITKFMALAIHLQNLIDSGTLCDYAQIATLTGLTRARITQIMNLNLLAPRIQEEILFMPKIAEGVDPISERSLRQIALKPRWDLQLKEWESFLKT
jgi:hypothetical protein